MLNKNEGNENKIMLGDLNCNMDKIEGKVDVMDFRERKKSFSTQ